MKRKKNKILPIKSINIITTYTIPGPYVCRSVRRYHLAFSPIAKNLMFF